METQIPIIYQWIAMLILAFFVCLAWWGLTNAILFGDDSEETEEPPIDKKLLNNINKKNKKINNLKKIDMKSKWYKSNAVYLFLVLVILVFNFLMIFFAAGYIETIWKISDTMSKILALGFFGLFVMNGIMLLRNKI